MGGLSASDCGEGDEGAKGVAEQAPRPAGRIDGKLNLVARGDPMSPPRWSCLSAAPRPVRATAVAATAGPHSQVRRPRSG